MSWLKIQKTKTHIVIPHREKIEHVAAKALFMIDQNIHRLTKCKIYCILHYKSNIKHNKMLNIKKSY